MKIEITKIVILTGSGPDKIIMTTTLPNGCYPYNGFQDIDMDVASENGEYYVKKHFPDFPYEIIKVG